MTPEAYGMHLNSATINTLTRQNLSAVALSLEMLVALVGLEEAQKGSAIENAKRYFTPSRLAPPCSSSAK